MKKEYICIAFLSFFYSLVPLDTIIAASVYYPTTPLATIMQENEFYDNSNSIGQTGQLEYGYHVGDADLTYSSACGGSWKISLDSITRSTEYGKPSFTSTDLFLLNGAKLVLDSIRSTATRKIYHTINESYKLIEYINPDTTTSYWIVTDNSGNKHYYGKQPDSRIEPVGTSLASPESQPRAWALSLIEDVGSFNFQKYTYIKNSLGSNATGDYALSKIIKGKVSDSQNGCTCTLIYYQADPHQVVSYTEGSYVKNTLRPITVAFMQGCTNTGDGGVISYAYKIDWGVQTTYTNASVVRQITKYANNCTLSTNVADFGQITGGSFLTPTFFEYSKFNTPFSNAILASTWPTQNQYFSQDSLRQYTDPSTGEVSSYFNNTSSYIDINGDGLPDRLVQNSTNNISVYRNKGDGTGFLSTPETWQVPFGTDLVCQNNTGKGTEIMLVDFNGDGLLDRVAKLQGNASLLFCRNNGSSFDPKVIYNQPDNSALRATHATSTRSYLLEENLDFNGDGLIDRVKLVPKVSTQPIEVYIGKNNLADVNEWIPFGTVPWSTGFYPTQVIHSGSNDSEVHWSFLDFNGDGLPDRVAQTDTNLYVFLNTSSGFELNPTVWPSSGKSISFTSYMQGGLGSTDATLISEDYIDFNGDGLLDRLWLEGPTKAANMNGSKLNIRFNTGSGFGSIFSIPLNGIPRDFSHTLHQNLNPSDGLSIATITDFIDIDGDGLIDRVSQNNTTSLTVYKNALGFPSETLLLSVRNSNGGNATYNYIPNNKVKNPGYRSKQWVLESCTVNDGLGSSEKTSYSYENGKYCIADHTDWGFGLVKRIDPDGMINETYYAHNDFTASQLADPSNIYLQDTPTKLIVKNASGKVFSSTITAYVNGIGSSSSSNYGYNVNSVQMGLRPAMRVYARQQKIVDSYAIDGMCDVGTDGLPIGTENTQWRHNRVEYIQYDMFGNVTSQVTGLHPDSDWTKDKTEISTSYLVPASIDVKWIFLPYEIKTRRYNTNGSFTDSGHTLYYYDGSATPNSVISQGLLTRVDRYYDSSHTISTSKTYDSKGNVRTETDGLGNTTTYDYDTVYYSYLKKMTPPQANLAVSYDYDPTYWRLETVTDPNGVAKVTKYDVFGRVVKSIEDGDSESLPTRSYEYIDTALASNGTITTPSCVITRNRVTSGQSSTIDTYCYYDGLGRVVQTKSMAEDESGYLRYRTQDSWAASDSVSHKTIAWQGVPYYSDWYTFDRAASARMPYTKTERWLDDSYGSVARTTEPSGAATTTFVRLDATIVVDANGHRTGVKTKPSENTVWKYRYSGVYFSGSPFDGPIYSTITVETTFDRARVLDNAANASVTLTDWLGRKTSSSDPDSGVWSLVYDANGNLKRQTDPTNVITTLTYDAMNRVTTKVAGSTTIESMIYDEGGAAAKALGRLTTLTFASGKETYAYDSRGRIATQSKTIFSKTATISRTYNDLGRVKTETMPDGETVTYTYDRGGMLSQVSGTDDVNPYIKNIRYYASSKVASEQSGNGRTTNYEYYDTAGDFDQVSGLDRSFRLKSIALSGLQLIYGYDKAGNVRRKNVNSDFEEYVYDDYDRLKSCYSTFSDPTSQSYDYDEIDNITTKDGSAYSYTSAHPHAAIQAGSTTYTYDALGNQTKSGGIDLKYDSQNRFVQMLKNNAEIAYYHYGAGLDRVRKSENGAVTYFFFPSYEQEYVNGSVENVKYYYADGRRIAQRRSKMSAALRTQYFHTDLLNSSVGLSDSSGLIWQMGYKPYGEDAYPIATGLPEYLNIAQAIVGQTQTIKTKELLDFSAPIQGASNVSLVSGQRIVFKPGMKVEAGSRLAAKIDATVFGDAIAQVRPRFTGQIKDTVGLYYFNARYYDPGLGRFISPDPATRMGMPLSVEEMVNPYMYCRNNPVRYVDPTGLDVGNPGNDGYYKDDATKPIQLRDDGSGGYYQVAGNSGDSTWGNSSDSAGVVGHQSSAAVITAAIAVQLSPRESLLDRIDNWYCNNIGNQWTWTGGGVKADLDMLGIATGVLGPEIALAGKAFEALGAGAREAGAVAGPHTVYGLVDPITGEVQYVGRTINPTARALAHAASEDKAGLVLTPLKEGLTYPQARGYEQALFEQYGGFDSLLNKINPISPTNPNRAYYMSAAGQ
jgi:RHS repeat-associated protein